MFKRKDKIEIVPESAYTDFSHRVPGDAYATRKTVAAAAVVPAVVSAGLLIERLSETTTTTLIPVTAPVNVVANPQPTTLPIDLASSPELIQTGFIADSSLEMLANILDPLVELMTIISLPIASVIMLGGAFFFMLGNTEKAWSTIFNAALGYIIIQMSPLFLEILRQVGEAV